jgi:hypothetical protein
MRLLHFLPVYAPAWQFGGPVLSVSRLCEALAAAGTEVEVITTSAGLPDWPAERLGVPEQWGGVRVVRYPVDRAGGAIRSRALEAALASHLGRADLLHLSAVWQPLGLPVQRAAHRAGVPVGPRLVEEVALLPPVRAAAAAAGRRPPLHQPPGGGGTARPGSEAEALDPSQSCRSFRPAL